MPGELTKGGRCSVAGAISGSRVDLTTAAAAAAPAEPDPVTLLSDVEMCFEFNEIIL